jgi:hypothetical protein
MVFDSGMCLGHKSRPKLLIVTHDLTLMARDLTFIWSYGVAHDSTQVICQQQCD